MSFVVDVHTHVVPSHIPAYAAGGKLWPSIAVEGDDASVMIDNRVFRRIDSRCWNVARRLDDMRGDGVDVQVLSPMPELLSHWFDPDAGEALGEIINDDIARMIAAAPGRFYGVGMVCMQDVARALRQIERIKALGFRGFEIGTHINGAPLGAERLWPIYEAAQALDMIVFVHPLHPAGVERIGAGGEYAAVATFPLETALAAVSLLAHGVMERYPNLRVLLSHGGGALPWILPRLDQGYGISAAMQRAMRENPSAIARRFWYDTIVYSESALRFMAQEAGEDHIVVGSDYPFTIKQDKPGLFASRALGADSPCLAANAEGLLAAKFGAAATEPP
ncbi:MAG: amidohydrolase [Hyphomicrobiales bacterium]|nr:amidohydrolase [Hyphomicrobiales bacterium]